MNTCHSAPRWHGIILIGVCIIALLNGGCLLVAAGTAGGVAAGYAYYKGKVHASYNAGFEDTWAATHTALNELGMPLVSEDRKGAKGHVVSKTLDGESVRIDLEAEPGKIPADGEMMHVSIRVSTFGDRLVSMRILDQIGSHLTPAPIRLPSEPNRLAPAPVPQATQAQQPNFPGETAPPPLLPSEPVPAKK